MAMPRNTAEWFLTRAAIFFENLTEAVIVVAPSGDVVFYNQACVDLTGLREPGNVYDPETNLLLYPDRRPVPQEERPIVRLLAGETVKDANYIVLRPDGTERRAVFNGADVALDGDTVIVATLRDVTEAHKKEELGRDTIHIVSHDLRNPLAVISAQARILKDSLTSMGLCREAKGMEEISKAADRMARLIQILVDSTKETPKPWAIYGEPVHLCALARRLADRLNSIQPGKRVRVEAPDPVPHIWADSSRVGQVLENLVNNALKYSPPETPVVVRVVPGEAVVTVSVTDRGTGIPQEEIPKLFQRFYRGSSCRGPEGLGLGLYIARRTVQDYGGEIWVESVPGQGSTFSFSLPVRQRTGVPSENQETQSQGG